MSWQTITVEMRREDMVSVYRFCADHLITLDELVEQFLRWTIANPEKAKQWIKETLRKETEYESKPEHA